MRCANSPSLVSSSKPSLLIIEPAHRENTLLDAAQQMHHRLAAFRIGNRGHATLGLVQREVDVVLGRAQQAAVDFDVIALEIRFRAQLGDRLRRSR